MAALYFSVSALNFSASPVSFGALGLLGAEGGVTRAKSTVKAPLSLPSFSMMRSAVSIELWRKPVVVVTTRTFLGLAAAVATGALVVSARAAARVKAAGRSRLFMVVGCGFVEFFTDFWVGKEIQN